MTEETRDYSALGAGGAWIEYVRMRLPYSFRQIRKQRRRFVLSDPQRLAGFARHHNFWQRGSVYYATGKLIDVYNLSRLWIEYRKLYAEKTRHSPLPGVILDKREPVHDVYNAMQFEKLWSPVQFNDIDRERVVMTNMGQAVELCLKAVKTHAEYRESGVFAFDDGHDFRKLYESLPQPLQDELEAESRSFAQSYNEFRRTVEAEVTWLESVPRAERDWEAILEKIDASPYTALLRCNDPQEVPDDWLNRAMESVRDSTYHRYSPYEGFDDYPTGPIHSGLMLGRFLYEHLFPVPWDTERGRVSRLRGLAGGRVVATDREGAREIDALRR